MKRMKMNTLIVLMLATSFMAGMLSTVVHGKTTITVSHRGITSEVEWMKSLKASFETGNPSIEIELVPIAGGVVGYAEKLALLWAAGTPPDVMYGYGDRAAIVHFGWTRDLTGLVERDAKEINLGDFLPGAWEIWKRDGKQVGVPLTLLGAGIFYNKELCSESGLAYPPASWEDPSWTWDALVAYGKKLTKADSRGLITQFGFSHWWGIDSPALTWLFGSDWFPEEAYRTGTVREMALFTPQNINAYQAVSDLHFKHGICAGPALAMAQSGNFESGKIAMDATEWWKVSSVYVPKAKFSWGVAPYPKVVDKRLTNIISDPLFMASATKHPEEAWSFMKYAIGREAMELYAATVNSPPARRSAFKVYLARIANASGLKEAEVFSAFVGPLEHGGRRIDVIVNWAHIKGFVAARLDPIYKGTQSVESTLEAAEKATNAFLQTLPW